MRIERIKIKNFTGLRDVDWMFPTGPVIIPFDDIGHQKLFRDLLLTILYDQQESQLLSSQCSDTLVEIWLSEGSLRYIIRHEYLQRESELIQSSTLLDDTGRKIYLPEKMMLGEYIFNAQLQAFLQGVIVEWPEREDHNDLILLISNLSQGGDEGLSLRKTKASLLGAQKKVKEQKESMELVKAEYDALRFEWESTHRQLEEERLLQIEIKNLQETEAILTERIAVATNIQMRIDLLSKNTDYRALRQLQDEITRLEEYKQSLEDNLKIHSYESSVDWTIIENYREECLEWAYLQKDLESLNHQVEVRSKRMEEIEKFLLTSGYQEFAEDEDLRLKLIAEERDRAQNELNKLILLKQELEKLKLEYSQEDAQVNNLILMMNVTEKDKNWVAKKEKHLEQWRSSKVCSIVEGMLRKGLGVKGIDDILSSRLLDFYRKYHVSDYQEFTFKLKEFSNQQKRIQTLQSQMENLQEKINHEIKLHKIVNSRNEILQRAFTLVHAADLSAWLKGWVEYQRKKNELSLELIQLNSELEQKLVQEKKLADCKERMGENLKNWGIPKIDREEVLTAILTVASQLQERDEINKEIAAFSENFERMLGKRDMEQLSKILEPLAELERENRLSNEERQAELVSWNERRAEIRLQIEALNKCLQNNGKSVSLSDLEKRIEQKKHQWMGYEDLRQALDDALTLLELSWQEWQSNYEKMLTEEKQWIYDHIFSSVPFKLRDVDTLTQRNYFSYRMAVAQLALHFNTELPLFFSLGKMTDENQSFWEDVIQYLYQLSHSRQLIISTADSEQIEKLSNKGWSSLGHPTYEEGLDG